VVPPEGIKKIICDVFRDKCEEALIIAQCESTFNPNNINEEDAKVTGYASYGLFQINGPDTWAWNDPLQNTLAAYDKYTRRGWNPWPGCKKKLPSI
jgi:hypothetical protein